MARGALRFGDILRDRLLRHLQPPPHDPHFTQRYSLFPFLARRSWFSATNKGHSTPKRYRDRCLDNVLRREKRVDMVLRVKEILARAEGQVMLLHELGKKRRKVRLPHSRKFIQFARKCPRVFRATIDEDNMAWIEFTDEFDEVLAEEDRVRVEYEAIAAENLAKLLMMAVNHRLQISKLGHLKKDLGLPNDFEMRLPQKYPHLFKTVEDNPKNGLCLELVSWDPSLAVTCREKWVQSNADDAKQAWGEGLPYSFKILPPNGIVFGRKRNATILRFQEREFPSPYEEIGVVKRSTAEHDKRHVALVHEFLSLTLHKRVIADSLSHFRKEFRLPQRLQSLLLRYQNIFYVSHKGDRYVVFLKEAYRGSTLLEKSPLVLMKERVSQLCEMPKRFSHRNFKIEKNFEESDSSHEVSDIEEGLEFSDVE